MHANLCQTFKMTRPEALDNLHILFKTYSEAARHSHKHVLFCAKSLDDVFSMMYLRFMSEENRERLLQKLNSVNFCDFVSNENDLHGALRKLCAAASSIQLQLVESYEDDQHLRDALLNAFKSERWTHRLAKMQTSRLLDVEEWLARQLLPRKPFQMREIIPSLHLELI